MRPEQDLSLQQQQPFAESCVPNLIQLARQNKRVVTQILLELPKSWPFEDRLLVAVLPSLRADVEEFHAGKGKAMTEMFAPHQLISIDHGAHSILLAKLVDSR